MARGRRIRKLLAQHGFVKVGGRKHEKWKCPETGEAVGLTRNRTDSERRANARLRSLQRRLESGRSVQKGRMG